MINILGTNIISSLGFTTEENFSSVKQGISGVKHYGASTFGLPEAFMASLIDKEKLHREFAKISSKDDYTDLEKAAVLSVSLANKEAQIDLSSEKTLFILSTTKGNIELLDTRRLDTRQTDENSLVSCVSKSRVYLWHTAALIAGFFKNPNTPLVVSNACISGAAAQIAAMRELEAGNCDYAVVVGVDFLSKFIISGFQSFKALSPELCRPFDKDRCGLNLGEAAATIIFRREISDMRYETNPVSQVSKSHISLLNGVIRNDANHISAPSRTGEGSFRALNYILNNSDSPVSNSLVSNDLASKNLKPQIAFINAHGTATPYNDAMEANAIVRAGLENVPVNSLKAFFGHTLGAAGVLESIISMKALEENMVLKSKGYNEQKFDNQINVSQNNQFSDKKYFVKMLSGFGGVNAALLFADMRQADRGPIDTRQIDLRCETDKRKAEKSRISKSCIYLSHVSKSQIPTLFIKKHIKLSFQNSAEITECYRSLQVDYPKFFKMDGLSKLGFLTSEIIFKNDENRFLPSENTAVICFNRSSSLDIDMQYQETIRNNENYFPSPSLFVYTLPNIVTGEITIRNKFTGETSFYVCKEFDVKQIIGIVKNAFNDKATTSVLTAWIEYFEEKLEVFMVFVENKKSNIEFTESQLKILYNA